jgi:hypothetical protein
MAQIVIAPEAGLVRAALHGLSVIRYAARMVCSTSPTPARVQENPLVTLEYRTRIETMTENARATRGGVVPTVNNSMAFATRNAQKHVVGLRLMTVTGV